MPENLSLEAHTLATVAAARLDAHEKTCTERYSRIAGDMAEIKAAIQNLSADLKGAVQRIHERVDDEALTARTEIRMTAAEAENAHKNIAGLKIWVLSGVGSALLAVVAWLGDHFIGGGG